MKKNKKNSQKGRIKNQIVNKRSRSKKLNYVFMCFLFLLSAVMETTEAARTKLREGMQLLDDEEGGNFRESNIKFYVNFFKESFWVQIISLIFFGYVLKGIFYHKEISRQAVKSLLDFIAKKVEEEINKLEEDIREKKEIILPPYEDDSFFLKTNPPLGLKLSYDRCQAIKVNKKISLLKKIMSNKLISEGMGLAEAECFFEKAYIFLAIVTILNSKENIRKLTESYLKYFRIEENEGLKMTLREGIVGYKEIKEMLKINSEDVVLKLDENGNKKNNSKKIMEHFQKQIKNFISYRSEKVLSVLKKENPGKEFFREESPYDQRRIGIYCTSGLKTYIQKIESNAHFVNYFFLFSKQYEEFLKKQYWEASSVEYLRSGDRGGKGGKEIVSLKMDKISFDYNEKYKKFIEQNPGLKLKQTFFKIEKLINDFVSKDLDEKRATFKNKKPELDQLKIKKEVKEKRVRKIRVCFIEDSGEYKNFLKKSEVEKVSKHIEKVKIFFGDFIMYAKETNKVRINLEEFAVIFFDEAAKKIKNSFNKKNKNIRLIDFLSLYFDLKEAVQDKKENVFIGNRSKIFKRLFNLIRSLDLDVMPEKVGKNKLVFDLEVYQEKELSRLDKCLRNIIALFLDVDVGNVDIDILDFESETEKSLVKRKAVVENQKKNIQHQEIIIEDKEIPRKSKKTEKVNLSIKRNSTHVVPLDSEYKKIKKTPTNPKKVNLGNKNYSISSVGHISFFTALAEALNTDNYFLETEEPGVGIEPEKLEKSTYTEEQIRTICYETWQENEEVVKELYKRAGVNYIEENYRNIKKPNILSFDLEQEFTEECSNSFSFFFGEPSVDLVLICKKIKEIETIYIVESDSKMIINKNEVKLETLKSATILPENGINKGEFYFYKENEEFFPIKKINIKNKMHGFSCRSNKSNKLSKLSKLSEPENDLLLYVKKMKRIEEIKPEIECKWKDGDFSEFEKETEIVLCNIKFLTQLLKSFLGEKTDKDMMKNNKNFEILMPDMLSFLWGIMLYCKNIFKIDSDSFLFYSLYLELHGCFCVPGSNILLQPYRELLKKLSILMLNLSPFGDEDDSIQAEMFEFDGINHSSLQGKEGSHSTNQFIMQRLEISKVIIKMVEKKKYFFEMFEKEAKKIINKLDKIRNQLIPSLEYSYKLCKNALLTMKNKLNNQEDKTSNFKMTETALLMFSILKFCEGLKGICKFNYPLKFLIKRKTFFKTKYAEKLKEETMRICIFEKPDTVAVVKKIYEANECMLYHGNRKTASFLLFFNKHELPSVHEIESVETQLIEFKNQFNEFKHHGNG